MLLLVSVLAGCDAVEQSDVELGEIIFGTSMMGNPGWSTRALVDNAVLKGDGFPVYVSAFMNGSQRLYPVNAALYGERIIRDPQTAKWSTYDAGNIKSWVSANRYAFNALAFLPSTAVTSGNLTINNYGNQIIVKQPTTYQQDQMVDYLYSHTFQADGRLHPVVQLDLEHAMALVEVKVVKHASISDAYLDEITVSNMWYSATMTCESPAVYNSGGRNLWSPAFTVGTSRDATYTRDGRHPEDAGDPGELIPLSTRDDDSGQVVMSFVAIPQQMDASNILTVSFWVNEKFDDSSPDNYVLHREEFELYNHNPIFWQSGHRITYILEVDTGIRLYGVISPWVDVDYIEGTVLPEIK